MSFLNWLYPSLNPSSYLFTAFDFNSVVTSYEKVKELIYTSFSFSKSFTLLVNILIWLINISLAIIYK